MSSVYLRALGRHGHHRPQRSAPIADRRQTHCRRGSGQPTPSSCAAICQQSVPPRARPPDRRPEFRRTPFRVLPMGITTSTGSLPTCRAASRPARCDLPQRARHREQIPELREKPQHHGPLERTGPSLSESADDGFMIPPPAGRFDHSDRSQSLTDRPRGQASRTSAVGPDPKVRQSATSAEWRARAARVWRARTRVRRASRPPPRSPP
jgi:hypothetical protein